MKILFYSPGARYYRDIGVILDEITIWDKQGHEVFVIYNNCTLGVCTANMRSASPVCKVCKIMMKKDLGLLPKSVKKIELHEYWSNEDNPYHHFNYNTTDDIRKIEYKGVKVGYSVLSSYFTITRNLTPLINKEFRNYFDKLISVECHLTDALDEAIATLKPDKICFFNARYFDWRPPYDLAVKYGIPAISYELTNQKGHNSKEQYINSTPHNVKTKYQKYQETWTNTQLNEKEKISIGESFFIKRRNSIESGDKVYTLNQKNGKLPSSWDPNKRNIVIFNSSEDEFAAIGSEYDGLKLFQTQYKGIKYIVDKLRDIPDIHIYLRIHPNLSTVPYRYHTELLKLGALNDHITVIPAADDVSTYAMMDAAEKVIVFGSTMGLESAYWGKPVILLAGASYYYSDICYVPKSLEELDTLLVAKLSPKDNAEAIKLAFYMMYCDPRNYYKYIDFDMEWFNMGRHKLLNIHYQKLFGSSKLYAIYVYVLQKLFRRINSSKNELPMEEDPNAEL